MTTLLLSGKFWDKLRLDSSEPAAPEDAYELLQSTRQ